jgi:hypothetical protein
MFSDLPLRADVARCSRHVRFAPKGDIAVVLDMKEATNKGGLQRAALVRATLLSPPDLNELSRHARQVPSNSEWLG